MFILLKRFIPWVAMILVILVAILGIAYFWKLNGKSLIWCSTHSVNCQIARLSADKQNAETLSQLAK